MELSRIRDSSVQRRAAAAASAESAAGRADDLMQSLQMGQLKNDQEKLSAVFRKLCRAKSPNLQFTKEATWPLRSLRLQWDMPLVE